MDGESLRVSRKDDKSMVNPYFKALTAHRGDPNVDALTWLSGIVNEHGEHLKYNPDGYDDMEAAWTAYTEARECVEALRLLVTVEKQATPAAYISVIRRSTDFMAQLIISDAPSGWWDCGRTAQEAVNSLRRTNPEAEGLGIVQEAEAK